MEPAYKGTMLCLPGLGGHKSVFDEYVGLLPEYNLHVIELVDYRKTLVEARAFLAAQPGPIPVFCHCYSVQIGIQLAQEMPEKVSKLIVLEPFFMQFSWVEILIPIALILVGISKFKDMLGLRRKHFTYVPDYIALAKYPDWVQPFFDLRWQNSTEYASKYLNALTYRLPPRVEVPTLIMFSSHGFTRSTNIKAKIQKVFVNGRIVTMPEGTHNVISVAAAPVSALIKQA